MQKQNSRKSGLHNATRILVDYFCFTVSLAEFQEYDDAEEKAVYLQQRIEKKFYLTGLEFQQRKGMYGYAYSAWYDGIVYAWGGAETIYMHRMQSAPRSTACCTAHIRRSSVSSSKNSKPSSITCPILS